MKAVYYEDFGSADVLKIGERPMPAAGPGQVLVKVAAAGVNPIDRRLRNGELQDFFERTWPIIPGWDFAGTIAELGEGVTGWKTGEPVMGLAFTWHNHHGTYAEYVPVDATAIARVPERFSLETAAALPLVSLTAWQSLHEFSGLKRGQSVLVQAGAGGVGGVAHHLGARVYTTAREHNWDYVRERGADAPIDYSQTDYVAFLKEAEPRGLDRVLESLSSQEAIENAIRLVKDGGSVPYMNNEPPDMPEIAARGINTAFLHHRADGSMLGYLAGLYDKGDLAIPQVEAWPLDRAREAHFQSESGTTRGKLVLTIDG
jgi:NADPH2:quinone reductase